MKRISVYLFVLFLISLKTSPASAAWRNLITCDNGVSVSIETNIPSKTQYKADIRNKVIIKNLQPTNSNTYLELVESSFYPPHYSRFSFSTKDQSRELKVVQLDRGSLFSFEVVSPQEITCAQEVCTSGCYAGDTPVWTCVDLRVTPESTLFKETAYCNFGPTK